MSEDNNSAKQLIQGNPTNEELQKLFWVPELNQQALELLMQRELDYKDLYFLIAHTDQFQYAWDQLLKRGLTNEELRDVLERVGVRKGAAEFLQRDLGYLTEYINILKQAAELLIERNPSNTDLCYLIRYSQYNEWALEELFSRNPSYTDLRYLIQFTPYKERAAKQLLLSKPCNADLRLMLAKVVCVEEAAQALLKQHPYYDDIFCLMNYSNYKEDAWKLFIKLEPDVNQLSYVISHTEFASRAAPILRARLGCEIVDEEGLMKEIARAILAQPEGFEMYNWHKIVPEISPLAKELTQEYNIIVAYCAVVPHYYNYYENASPEEWIEKLKELANK